MGGPVVGTAKWIADRVGQLTLDQVGRKAEDLVQDGAGSSAEASSPHYP